MTGRFHYSRGDAAEALRTAGLKAEDIVFCHSNLGFFGVPEGGATSANACDTILGAFQDVLGPEGTLVLPSFTYAFARGLPFDPDRTPSDNGALPEVLRAHPDAVRSHDPNVSVVALGARAEELTRDAPENAYGPDSFFDRFYRAGGKICTLNLDAGSTFVHYVERHLRVPYRFDKTFEGTFQKDGHEELRTSTIWVRDLASDKTTSWMEPFDCLAREEGLFRTASLGRGSLGMISAQDTMDLIARVLPTDPWFLTRAHGDAEPPHLSPEAR